MRKKLIFHVSTALLTHLMLAVSAFAAGLEVREVYTYVAPIIRESLSATGANRIEFENRTIREIIGDESKYKLLVSSDNKNLFLFPKIPSGGVLTISAVTTSGEVKDMEFTVRDIGSRALKIEFSTIAVPQETDIEAKQMLEAMERGIKGKYYVKCKSGKEQIVLAKKDRPGVSEKFGLREKTTYRYANLTGRVFTIVNRSKGTVFLNDGKVLHLSLVGVAAGEAIYKSRIDKSALYPRERGFLFVVTRDAEDV